MLMDKLDEYRKVFGEGFPMIPLAWGRDDDEIIKLIDQCISKKKSVYDLGLVNDEDIY